MGNVPEQPVAGEVTEHPMEKVPKTFNYTYTVPTSRTLLPNAAPMIWPQTHARSGLEGQRGVIAQTRNWCRSPTEISQSRISAMPFYSTDDAEQSCSMKVRRISMLWRENRNWKFVPRFSRHSREIASPFREKYCWEPSGSWLMWVRPEIRRSRFDICIDFALFWFVFGASRHVLDCVHPIWLRPQ